MQSKPSWTLSQTELSIATFREALLIRDLHKLNLPMFRTKIRGATIPDRFTTFCGMHASALLHWTEKQPPLTSKASSHESLAQHSSLHVFILVVRLRIEKSPALAPSRRVALYHSRPSLVHFFMSMSLDFEVTSPVNYKRWLGLRRMYQKYIESTDFPWT